MAKSNRKAALKAGVSRKAMAPTTSRSNMRAFDAGKIGRRLRAIPTNTRAINSLIRQYGRNVIARSRYLCANNPYAASAKEEFVAYLVGTGITPSSMVESPELKTAIQDTFLEWTDEADADSITDFYGMQALVAAELFEAGECFVRIRKRFLTDGFLVPLQLQLLPSEMLPIDDNRNGVGTNRIECGIEFDAIGRRVAYHFLTSHPGDRYNYSTSNPGRYTTRVPADEVLHLYRPIRAGQIRGIPMTLAGMITLAMLDLYDDAELERKRLAALFGAFITKGLGGDDNDAGPLATAPTSEHGDGTTGQIDVALEPGATVELDYGQDVKFAEPADVGGNYEAFQKRSLLKAATGFMATYHGMTGDTGGASFSSMRADYLRLKRRIEPIQHHIMVFQFCRKVWNAWFDAAVSVGAIEGLNARDYLASKVKMRKVRWVPPKWEYVNPQADVAADIAAVNALFKPRSAVIEASGEDPEQTDDTISKDQERATRKGIKVVQSGSGAHAAPTADDPPEPAVPPEPGNEDDLPPEPGKKPAPKPPKKRGNK